MASNGLRILEDVGLAADMMHVPTNNTIFAQNTVKRTAFSPFPVAPSVPLINALPTAPFPTYHSSHNPFLSSTDRQADLGRPLSTHPVSHETPTQYVPGMTIHHHPDPGTVPYMQPQWNQFLSNAHISRTPIPLVLPHVIRYSLDAVSQKDLANALAQLKEQPVLMGAENLASWDEAIRLTIVQLGLFPHICGEPADSVRCTWHNTPIYPLDEPTPITSEEDRAEFKKWESNDFMVLSIITAKISDDAKRQLPCTVGEDGSCISARSFYDTIHTTWGTTNLARLQTIRNALFQTVANDIGKVDGYVQTYWDQILLIKRGMHRDLEWGDVIFHFASGLPQNSVLSVAKDTINCLSYSLCTRATFDDAIHNVQDVMIQYQIWHNQLIDVLTGTLAPNGGVKRKGRHIHCTNGHWHFADAECSRCATEKKEIMSTTTATTKSVTTKPAIATESNKPNVSLCTAGVILQMGSSSLEDPPLVSLHKKDLATYLELTQCFSNILDTASSFHII
ncbi:hypothetical protein E1B28_008445 [Marasmius oreades]|uniref:Uncharacterized protein n=1 Tax=Marasmius oreades TaxID=181124 RepID=A0A9P7RYC1_9AGAR|nr:uncharacterized protein E1B28_008445 [Marasmius oreades]KAG7092064.1 hypothetical protein E1B28_008445 [Marasmius oreades]